jgi:hypothetical protein
MLSYRVCILERYHTYSVRICIVGNKNNSVIKQCKGEKLILKLRNEYLDAIKKKKIFCKVLCLNEVSVDGKCLCISVLL